jgi:transcriptional regulator with XRE-family HTH domain
VIDPDLPSANEYAALGKALCVLREQAGLTQKQAGAKIGIRDTFISQIENGHRGMRWHTLLAFLRAYEADLSALGEEIDRHSAKP